MGSRQRGRLTDGGYPTPAAGHNYASAARAFLGNFATTKS